MDPRREQALELMARYAERTGLSSGRPPQRYLWTDAFAVCTFLGLGRSTGDARHVERALQLVDQVHGVLGRHRADDRRRGWISGLSAAEGAAHPTSGGLRIGKPLPERRSDEPIDERREWDRDGQYFHYLTKWMHALDQVGRSTGQPLFNVWARELAAVAHRAFAYAPGAGGRKRMCWKLSIDLSRPLVGSMGQHDPLDGLVTYAQLEAAAAAPGPKLAAAIADFAAMVDPHGLASDDPLGLGGLLVDAYRLVQLERQSVPALGLVDALLEAALAGLRHYAARSDLGLPATHRLAFRELGLSIGLGAVERDELSTAGGRTGMLVAGLSRHLPLRAEIESFWLQPAHRRVDSWVEHENINDVTLATSLAPEGFLVLLPPRR